MLQTYTWYFSCDLGLVEVNRFFFFSATATSKAEIQEKPIYEMKNEGHAPDLGIISMYIKKSVLETYQEDNNQWEDLRGRGWGVVSLFL